MSLIETFRSRVPSINTVDAGLSSSGHKIGAIMAINECAQKLQMSGAAETIQP